MIEPPPPPPRRPGLTCVCPPPPAGTPCLPAAVGAQLHRLREQVANVSTSSRNHQGAVSASTAADEQVGLRASYPMHGGSTSGTERGGLGLGLQHHHYDQQQQQQSQAYDGDRRGGGNDTLLTMGYGGGDGGLPGPGTGGGGGSADLAHSLLQHHTLWLKSFMRQMGKV